VYGNTRLAAEEIARGLSQSGNVVVTIASVEKLDPAKAREFPIVVIGAPNHLGNASKSMRDFLPRLGNGALLRKRVALFDTCYAHQTGIAVRKMEEILREKEPNLHLSLSGLSVVVEGSKGPVRQGDLLKCRQFGMRLASPL
jgi:flavodoxin